MKKNVLITGCSKHSKGIIDCLKQRKESIKIYGVDCNEHNLLKEGLDGYRVVPRIDSPDYIDTLIDYCIENEIGVIFPYITIELHLLASNVEKFEKYGIKISVDTPEKLDIANDKAKFLELFSEYMPVQIRPKTVFDIHRFVDTHKKACVKITNGCGGAGFAIIDDEKAKDISLFNKSGVNRYISKADLLAIFESGQTQIILQQYIEGLDYSVCTFTHGKGIEMCGYVGYSMVYGAVMSAEIQENKEAYEITRKVVEKIGLESNACFDFMIEKETNKVYLLECNPRLNASLPFVAQAGLNVPYYRYLQLIGMRGDMQFPEIKYGLKMQKYYETKYY